ncbi:MAG: hypothetical protein Q9204_002085 [Flavoplaca sp. TL-2023a]
MINNTDASYLFTGGTGGIGRSIIGRLARKGAKKIMLASLSSLDQKAISELVSELQTLGIADHTQVQALIARSEDSRPPIRGVTNGAIAVRDALFENLTHTDWQMNIFPSIRGARNLQTAHPKAELLAVVKAAVIILVAGLQLQPGKPAPAWSSSPKFARVIAAHAATTDGENDSSSTAHTV